MTRPIQAAADADGPGQPGTAGPAPPQRRIERARRLPGSRAVVGGLLVALAGVGTLAAWQQAAGTPDRSYAVAARPLQPGESLAAADVRLVPVDLPAGVAGAAFTSPGEVEGRVALGPIGEGELLQAASLSEPGAGVPTAEVSFALARDRALDGRLGSGDLVDVYVTYDDRGTSVVGERVQVVAVTDGGASFASGAELTVTLSVPGGATRTELVQAVRSGEVTLVRSTHLGPPASGAGSPPDASTGAGPSTPATGMPPPPAGTSPGPSQPPGPDGTTASDGPDDPTEPTDTTELTDPTEPTELTEPTEPTGAAVAEGTG